MKSIKMSLSKKILLIFLICILFPVLLTAFYFHANINRILRQRAQDSLEYSVDMVTANIENLGHDTEEIAVAVGLGDIMQSILQEEYDSYDEFYKVYNSPVTNFLREMTTAKQGIYRIAVYTDNPTIYNSSFYANFSEEPQALQWVSDLKAIGKTRGVFSRLGYKNGIEQSGILRPQIIACYRIIPTSADYPYEMAVCVEMEMEQIYEWMQENEEGIVYYLINDKNEIVASTNQMYEPLDMEEFALFDEQENVNNVIRHTFSFRGSMEGWKLVGEAKEELLMEDLNKITTISVSMILGMLVLSAVILYLLIRPYTTRLWILSRRMEHFNTEDLSPVITKPYQDEVEVVIQNYNQMMSQMDVLINQVYALNMQKKELELNQIQIQMNQLISQVNPHFLFNTLNAILAISEKNHYTEVSWCLEHLALMMRKLLDWSHDKISVQEEMEFIRMYLDIEKLRFAEQFDYEIHMDEDAKCCNIPKMSIQPLVENACKYGIHRSAGYGKVSVQAKCEKQHLYIRIFDTGTALTAVEIEKIKQDYSSEESSTCTGVGLKNVYRRLRLYYGNQAEMIIENMGSQNCFGFVIGMEDQSGEENNSGR